MTEIKVGDTVRIKDTQPEGGYASKGIGEEFVVTALDSASAVFGAKPDFAIGDKEFTKLGVFLKHLELVEPEQPSPWRYNDHIVVYPETRDAGNNKPSQYGLGRGVTILNETPLPKIYTRWENRDYSNEDRFEAEITAAARAYFEAHSLPKPAWHNPRTGEAWELTVNGDTGPFVVVYNPWEAADREYRFQAGNGTLVDYTSDEITAGRRIYPEPTE